MKDEQVRSAVPDPGKVGHPSGEDGAKNDQTAERVVTKPADDDELADPIKLAQRMSEFLSRRY